MRGAPAGTLAPTPSTLDLDPAAPTASREDLEARLGSYRPELVGYCYRMLGSVFEADDAAQETLLRAWRGLGRFESRAQLRSWLYRIATNVCLDALSARGRRAMPTDVVEAGHPGSRVVVPPAESRWIEPLPNAALTSTSVDPGDQLVAREDVRLAFVAALQRLTPRQRAVLILRDVLRWRASEVADLLDATPAAVNSALQRARAAMAANYEPARSPTEVPPGLLDRYVDAFERYDVQRLVALLQEDATWTMPPLDLWFHGRRAIRAWLERPDVCRHHRLLPTSANGAPAFALYLGDPAGSWNAFAIQVIDVDCGAIAGIHTFQSSRLVTRFGFPDRLG